MSVLDRIVDINITRETRGVASANFSTPMIVVEDSTGLLPRIETFTSSKAVLDAGYAGNTVEYLSAVVHFAQDLHPPVFKIGHHDTSGAETLSEALNAIVAEDNDWYGLLLGSPVGASYVTAHTFAKANGKFLFAGDKSTEIVDSTEASDTTSTAYLLNNASANKSHVIYNSKLRETPTGEYDASDSYADVAYCSAILGRIIGSYTGVYKALSATNIDKVSDTQMTNLFDKNASFYHTLYSRAIIEGGRVCDGNTPRNGEWLDVEIGLDWLEVRMQEAVFTTITNAEKIPYTDEGTQKLASSVESVLSLAVRQGFLSDFTITVEPVSEQTTNDKANRTYNGISWDAQLTGAIHTVTINGNVRV